MPKEAVVNVPVDLIDLSHIVEDLRPLAVSVEILNVDMENVRKGHDLDGIAKSIEKYGQRKPIVINKSKGNTVIAGNGTFVAIRDILKRSHVAAVFVQDREEDSTGYAIADNRLGDLSYFDPEALLKELAEQAEIPGGDSLYEIIREVRDEEPVELDEVAELVAGDSNLDGSMPITFILDAKQYEAYLDTKAKIGNSKTDEEILAYLIGLVK